MCQIVVDNTPSTSSRPSSFVPEDDDLTVPGSTSSSVEQVKRPSLKRRAPAVQDNQSVLYCKYLAVSIELKELKKKQILDNNKVKDILEDIARLDCQSSKANLERVLCKKKQEEELFQLEKEKLIKEINNV